MVYLTVTSKDVPLFAYHVKDILGAFWISEDLLAVRTRQGIVHTRISENGNKYVFKFINYFAMSVIAEKILKISEDDHDILLELEFTTDELFALAGLEGIVHFTIKNGRVKSKTRMYLLKEYDSKDKKKLLSVFLITSSHKLTHKDIYFAFQQAILNDKIKKIDEATKDLYNIFNRRSV